MLRARDPSGTFRSRWCLHSSLPSLPHSLPCSLCPSLRLACQLVSCSEDGAVYLFHVNAPKDHRGEIKRSADILTKNCAYETVSICPVNDNLIYAAGSDRTVRVRCYWAMDARGRRAFGGVRGEGGGRGEEVDGAGRW